MSKSKSEFYTCDYCNNMLGHLENEVDPIVNKTRLMVVMLDELSFNDTGKQAILDFCNIDCMRKFFASDDYKHFLSENEPRSVSISQTKKEGMN